MLEFIMLGFLMYREMSGYDLKQCMLKSTSNFFDASFGSIYPALKKMESRGDVVAREVVDGGKFKKLYSISEQGKETFMEWLEQPISFSRTKQDHLVHVLFFNFLSQEKRIRQLQLLIEQAETVLTGLALQEEEIRSKAGTYGYATLQYGLSYYQFVINWCRSLLLEETGNA